MIVIDKSIIGSTKHILVDETGMTSEIDDVIPRAWHINGHIKNNTSKCLDSLLKLNDIEVRLQPPEQFVSAWAAIIDQESQSWPPPWKKTMPATAHEKFQKTIISELKAAIDHSDRTFYEQTWVKENVTYESLKCAHINKQKLATYIESGEGNQSALRSFLSDCGLAPKITYNRFGSRTGRPTIESGPNILALKREHRDIISSQWGADGSVVMLDFKALETRIVLYESENSCDVEDPYEWINEKLFKSRLTRDVVKGAIICDMYGQSKHEVSKTIGVDIKHVDFFLKKLKQFLGTDVLLDNVKKQFIKSGHVKNRFGRIVQIDDPRDHIVMNSYVQSTGADVAMLGFVDIISRMNMLRATPLYFIVDAMIVDCHNDDLEKLKEINSAFVPGYEKLWPVKLSIIS